MIGLNAPADARLSAQFFDFNKSHWTRAVLKPEYDLTPWIDEHHRLGMSVLGVIARESQTGSYEETAAFYRDRYGDALEALQVGNEADHESPSSWHMEPWELNELLAAFRQHFPDTTIVGPGLVSGVPSYLDNVDLAMVDAIAVHPYGQRPDNVDDWSELPGNFGTVGALLDSYRPYGKPIWVTEVGLSTTECSPEFQARYCYAMLSTLNLRRDVPVAMWFCADDAMVPEFGLYDSNGSPKPSAAAFMRAAGGTEPTSGPRFQLGFKDVADRHPMLIGKAKENEHGFMQDLSIQWTENGILFWANTVGGGQGIGFKDFKNGDLYKWDGSKLVKA
jgi:hypothetical protein